MSMGGAGGTGGRDLGAQRWGSEQEQIDHLAQQEHQIHEAEVVRDRYPLLHDVTATIGDPQVRNWGTIGGSVAHADPASDWPAVLIAGNATIVCRSQTGDRTIAAREFFIDTFQTAIEPTEVLTEIRVVHRPRASAGAYEKLERKVGDFATVGVAVHLSFDNGKVRRAGIALTGVGPSNLRARTAEEALAGAELDDDTIEAAAALAAEAAQPRTDHRGSADYKRGVVRVFTERGLRKAAETTRAARDLSERWGAIIRELGVKLD